MNRVILATAAASSLLIGSASAADLVLPAAEEVFVPESLDMTWAGLYAGVHIGAGFGTVHMDGEDDDDGLFDFPDGDFDNAGWLAGVQVGYNAQFDSLVVGVEADIAWTNLTSEDFFDDDEDESFDVNALGSIRGRLGFAAENFLIYATAGGAFASTNFTMGGDDEDDGALLGWVAGVGAEAMLTDSMSLKAEYLFHDFGAETFEFGDVDELDNDLLLHTVKVGVNFHF